MGANAIIPSPRSAVQARIFQSLGISKDEARRKFQFLLDALQYGAPPHGGIALQVIKPAGYGARHAATSCGTSSAPKTPSSLKSPWHSAAMLGAPIAAST